MTRTKEIKRLRDIGERLHTLSQPLQIIVANISMLGVAAEERGLKFETLDKLNEATNKLADEYRNCIILISNYIKELENEEK